MSISDSEIQSLISDSRPSSTSTILGPGAIAGKAIKSLGEFTLRGVDRIIIYTRLRSALAKFPHNDAQAENIKGIDAIYDTILELSRPGLYTPSIRHTVLSVIFAQILARQTQQLVLALRRWDFVELEIFFHCIMPISPSADLTPPGSIYSDFTLSISRIILLMSHVAPATDATCQLVFDMGYFNLLYFIDLAELSPDEIADICSTVFHMCTRPRNHQSAMANRGRLFLAYAIRWSLRPIFVNGLAVWAERPGDTFGAFIDDMWQFHDGTHPLTDQHQINDDFLETFMTLLISVARISVSARRTVVYAGYLDAMLFLAKQGFFLEREIDSCQFSLGVLRDGVPQYTQKQISKAMDLFLYPRCGYRPDFSTNNPQSIIENLKFTVDTLIIAELSALQISDARHVIESMLHEICHSARVRSEDFQEIFASDCLNVLIRISGLKFGAPLNGFINIVLQVLRSGRHAQGQITNLVTMEKAWKMLKAEIKLLGGSFDPIFHEIKGWALVEINYFCRTFMVNLRSSTQDFYSTKHAVFSFIAEFALQDEMFYQAVLEAGFMDVIKSEPGDSDNIAVKNLIKKIVEDHSLYGSTIGDQVQAYVLFQILLGRSSFWSDINALEDFVFHFTRDEHLYVFRSFGSTLTLL